MKTIHSFACCSVFVAATAFAASEWPDKAACEAIAGKIANGMYRKDVELLLKPYKPYPMGGGGQGGPQSSSYVIAPGWALIVWYDLHQSSGVGKPNVLSPYDLVHTNVTVVRVEPPLAPTAEQFREFQKLLK